MTSERTIALAQAITRAQSQLDDRKKELRCIRSFTGDGVCSVSLSNKTDSVFINFKQLGEAYVTTLLPALETITIIRLNEAEDELKDLVNQITTPNSY